MKELINIQSGLKVPKNQRNDFGKYNFRSAEDILESVKPLLAKEKCFLTISDELILVGDRYYIQATAMLTNSEGKIVQTTALAREEFEQKGMNSAQLTGSTSSYARKYALNGLFAIDDTKDDDFNNTHDKTVKKAPQTPPVVPTFDIKDIQTKIDACKSVEELMGIWADNKSLQANDAFVKILTTKKRQLNESK